MNNPEETENEPPVDEQATRQKPSVMRGPEDAPPMQPFLNSSLSDEQKAELLRRFQDHLAGRVSVTVTLKKPHQQ